MDISVQRCKKNPILAPEDVNPSRDFLEVAGVFNPAAVEVGRETVLLVRVAEKAARALDDRDTVTVPRYNVAKGDIEILRFSRTDPELDCSDPRVIRKGSSRYLSTLSHLRLARSEDGIHFSIDSHPLLVPERDYEVCGIEDPRITCLEGNYYITYTAVSVHDIATGLMMSHDLMHFERKGLIFRSFNRNVAIFTEKIQGKYVALHRPFGKGFERPSIWLATSDDLHTWENVACIMSPRNGSWDSSKIGTGPVPVRLSQGWLLLYHGVDDNEQYSIGAALLRLEDPAQVIARSKEAILSPDEAYEKHGFFKNTVFLNGAVQRQGRGVIDLYYGACDQHICHASVGIDYILDKLA